MCFCVLCVCVSLSYGGGAAPNCACGWAAGEPGSGAGEPGSGAGERSILWRELDRGALPRQPLRLGLKLDDEPASALLQCDDLCVLGDGAEGENRRHDHLGEGDRVRVCVQVLGEQEEGVECEALLLRVGARA